MDNEYMNQEYMVKQERGILMKKLVVMEKEQKDNKMKERYSLCDIFITLAFT